MGGSAPRDDNHFPTLCGVSYLDNTVILPILIDPVSGRVLAEYPSGASSAAPDDAHYLILTANATLTNAQDLGLLTTGLMKMTITAGEAVVSKAVEGTDYYAPGGSTFAVADGGTGADNATDARANLGLEIGVDVQAYDDTLQSISGLGTTGGIFLYTTALDTWAESPITAFGRSLVDDADAAAARATLGLVIGTNVQAYDADLAALAGVSSAADALPYFTGVATASVTTLTAFGRSLIDDADAAAARTTLGLVIGTNVQAYDATLQSISSLGTTSGVFLYTTATDTWAESAITAFGRSLVDDADAAAARTTLGLGSLATASTINNDNWSGTDLSVANGGTGASSFTAYAVLCGGTSSTDPLQSIAGLGTAGQVLTSNGPDALPTMQDAQSSGGLGNFGGEYLFYPIRAMAGSIYNGATNEFVFQSVSTVNNSQTYTWSDLLSDTTDFDSVNAVSAGGFEGMIAFKTSSNTDAWVGFGGVNVHGAVNASAAFMVDGSAGHLYAYTANGISYEETDLGVYTSGEIKKARVEYSQNAVVYYIDNVEVARHVTYIPTTLSSFVVGSIEVSSYGGRHGAMISAGVLWLKYSDL